VSAVHFTQTNGRLQQFNGVVEEVDEARSRLNVAVSIFDSAKLVELEFGQAQTSSRGCLARNLARNSRARGCAVWATGQCVWSSAPGEAPRINVCRSVGRPQSLAYRFDFADPPHHLARRQVNRVSPERISMVWNPLKGWATRSVPTALADSPALAHHAQARHGAHPRNVTGAIAAPFAEARE
jgi:hypothetical protein